ncbi:MAG: 4a-hydroxytetrahydrobiopterin dehydratase [Phycisphaeraceae bacterium]|nr:4a-hydroxytetrahydrobiopterin dehydratase [Phycisphaeraceae bacterium]
MARKTTPTYDEPRIAARLQSDLPQWEYRDGWIRRTYKTGGWPHTLMVVNAIGYLAEAAFHHPDLSVSWAQVTVKLMTHSAKGVTDKDFDLARRIEEQLTWLPGENSALEGFEQGFGKKWTR